MPTRSNRNSSKSSFWKWSIGGVSTLALFLVVIFVFAEWLTCSGAHGNIRCLANHPFAFQLVDQAGNPILDVAMANVESAPCADPWLTADTLKVAAALVPNNVHYSEEAAELVDSILVRQPECFLEASEQLNQKLRLKLNFLLDALEDVDTFKSKGRDSLRRFAKESRFAKSLRDFHVAK